jgi:hypothetical protein
MQPPGTLVARAAFCFNASGTICGCVRLFVEAIVRLLISAGIREPPTRANHKRVLLIIGDRRGGYKHRPKPSLVSSMYLDNGPMCSRTTS